METDLYDPTLPPIDNFEEGDHTFLSNFYKDQIVVLGITFDSVEHAYQAMKATNLRSSLFVSGRYLQPHPGFDDGVRIVYEPHGPGKAKKLGRAIECRRDWEAIKIDVMRFCLALKFKNPVLKAKLLATGRRHLIEGNHWDDYFWGVCNGIGKNNLGICLMQLRQELSGS